MSFRRHSLSDIRRHQLSRKTETTRQINFFVKDSSPEIVKMPNQETCRSEPMIPPSSRSAIILAALFVALTSGRLVFASDTKSEAGSYRRKSISFVDELWLADQSVTGLSRTHRAYLLDNIKQSLLLSRFDRNPLPPTLLEQFKSSARELKPGSGYLDSVSALINATLVPPIIEVIDMHKKERGAKLQTEQQKNSFMSDKAKELGLTAQQLQYLMNSAYVFIPLCRGYKQDGSGEFYSVELEIGVVLWKIVNEGDSTRAEVGLKKFVFATGSATPGKEYVKDGSKIGYQRYAFESAVDNAIMNLTTALQKLDEFRLSTQVTRRRFTKVAFESAEDNGIKVDDRFRIVHAVENTDGSITKKNRGWVLVHRLPSKRGGDKATWAKVIAGRPVVGTVLDEYPRIPIQLTIGGVLFPLGTQRENYSDLFVDSLSVEATTGFRGALALNIGRALRIPQLFFEVAYAMGFGSASGTAHFGSVDGKLKSCMNMHFEGSLAKKFYLRRIAFLVRPTFSYAQILLYPGIDLSADTQYRFTGYAFGFIGEGGMELALAPSVSLGITSGYAMYTPSLGRTVQSRTGSGDWVDLRSTDDVNGNGVDLSGLRLGAYLDFSLPSLSNNPIKALGHSIRSK